MEAMMARRPSDIEDAALPMNATFAEWADRGMRQMNSYFEMQSKLALKMQEANATWAKRMEAGGAKVADLALKMASAGSMPAAAAAWQEWTTEQMRLLSEDSRRMVEDLQELLTTGTQALTQNWSPARDEGRGRHSTE